MLLKKCLHFNQKWRIFWNPNLIYVHFNMHFSKQNKMNNEHRILTHLGFYFFYHYMQHVLHMSKQNIIGWTGLIFTMYFTKIFFVIPKSHKHFHPSSVVPLCKAAVKGLNNLSTQHALKTLLLASFVNRFYCWNIEVVYEVSRSPWQMCPWNTMKSVPACVKMILTDLRHV